MNSAGIYFYTLNSLVNIASNRTTWTPKIEAQPDQTAMMDTLMKQRLDEWRNTICLWTPTRKKAKQKREKESLEWT